ncbi:uncharacterized protein LOC115095536 isoform X4 [Rhinatrema bivittatum]|uniref:uncharacterized protein LOC115095536 isoform X4 n=1 Tax=Rhinatrema bivittatum TaxID=194408 RepID=UPI00112BDD3F|nr:uncharacterized protein LOC115095536 isoform X4 [Rhinatrema bivittatum]
MTHARLKPLIKHLQLARAVIVEDSHIRAQGAHRLELIHANRKVKAMVKHPQVAKAVVVEDSRIRAQGAHRLELIHANKAVARQTHLPRVAMMEGSAVSSPSAISSPSALRELVTNANRKVKVEVNTQTSRNKANVDQRSNIENLLQIIKIMHVNLCV